ncbi:LCP family protein required for cell wall assembly [Deinococcus metalli]|uniref:LCP family protein required for cell wall assembly n=1 Tax=Deinococcus metalli TaxID=1141878 RepID=A0A7W8KIA6_9DEIO|nr:LCP family protein [Deinococcus metalli]MBB5378253.1 LCP family protein required for cell wall assembly [Deinococcus metalli]
MRARVVVGVVLAAVVAVAAPAAPFLARYGAWPQRPDRPVTVLLAGVAPRYDDTAPVWPWPAKPEDYSGNTDTILLAQARPDGQVNLLSIPRDSWMNIPGWGYGKINGANPHGGPDMLIAAVQKLTGVHVDGYAFVSLYALRALTDAAGGITLDVPSRMKYDDNAGHLHIDLQPGPQHLNGVQAEGFLRFRHDNLGDIGRVARQQLFLKALAGQVKRPWNWWRVPLMLSAVDRNTKSGLDKQTMGALLGAAAGGMKLQTSTVPGTFGYQGAASVWNVDQAALDALVAKSFRDPNDPRFLNVAVVNVDAPDGSARRLKTRLEELGYRNVSIANGPRGPAATTISGTLAGRVQRDVGHGSVAATAGVPGADVTVRLGSDTPAN